jgi:hypothetical protein
MLVSQSSIVGAKAILGLKDIILYCVFFVVLVNILYSRTSNKIDVLSFLIVFFVLFMAVNNDEVPLLSVRQLLVIPLGLIFGSFLYKGNIDFKSVFNVYMSMMVFLVVAAYFERFILYDASESFWNMLGIESYMNMKGMVGWANVNTHVPNSFYSYDFYNYTGEKIRRMVSIIAEPTLFGQLLVLPSLYYLLSKKYLCALFFMVPIILAFSKGGVLGVTVGFTLYYWRERSNVLHKISILILIILAFLVIVFLYINNSVQSITNHLNGFITNMMVLLEQPFGLGIGKVGNFYNIAAGGTVTSGESYVGTIVGQFGIIGLFLFLLFFYIIYKFETNNVVMLNATKYTMLAVLITGVFSESAISYVGTSLLLILTSYLLNYRRIEYRL